jgi:WD40 repeat protein
MQLLQAYSKAWNALGAGVSLFIAQPLFATEPPSAPVLRIEAEMHTAGIKRISSDARSSVALTVSDDKTARLWELPSGKLLRVLRPPVGEGNEGKLFCGALSPDGVRAAVGGWTGYEWDKTMSIYLFDTVSGRLLRRIGGLPEVVNDLAFSPDGSRLAAALGGGNGIRLFEPATGKLIGEDKEYGAASNGVSFSPDGRRLASGALDGSVRLYSLAAALSSSSPSSAAKGLRLVAKEPVRGGKEPHSIRFSPDGTKLVVGCVDSTAVVVVSSKDLSFLFAPDTAGVNEGNLASVAWSADGQTVFAAGTWEDGTGVKRIRRWSSGGKGVPKDTQATSSTVMDLRPLSGAGLLFGAADPSWGIVDATGERALFRQMPVADFPPAGRYFNLSADASVVGFAFEAFGKKPAQFSLSERTLQRALGTSSGATSGFSRSLNVPKLDGIPVTNWNNTIAPKLRGEALALERYERSRSLAIAPDNSFFVLGTEFWLRCFVADGAERWKVAVPAPVWAVNLSADGQLVVAAYGDGTIRWHKAADGGELLAFFPHADQERWVLWTPEGYYDASPKGEELIGWHLNRGKDTAADFFPAAKFRDQFYRPDVTARVLQTKNVTTALKEANEEAGRRTPPPGSPSSSASAETVIARMQPPIVELAVAGAAKGSVEVEGTTFLLRYRVRSSGEPATRVRVLVDGRPVEAEAPLPGSATATAEAKVTIPARDCVVSVLAENKFAVSEPATLRLVHKVPTPAGGAAASASAAQPTALKPKLYLLAAGVTDYLNNDQLDDLHFAAKDARDFAAAFQRQEGGLYGKVEAKVLGDKEATAANILDGLDWIKAQTTSKDIAVIFLSGHGENDEQLRYYFCPHDYDKGKRLRTGVGFEQIQKTVQGLAGKVLFFIDSCHAGNALGKLFAAKSGSSGVDVTRIVNELSGAENGAIVFTSSTGRQLSLELSQEGNGAFTKALVEGLDGQADLLRNGTITVSTLEAFVAERVKKLTEGQQSPTVAKPQTVPDFPIAVKR